MGKKIFFYFIFFIQISQFTPDLFGYYYNRSYQYNYPYNPYYYDPIQYEYPNRTEEEKQLSARIERAFQEDPVLSPYASSIQVYSIGREVTLTGLIDSDRIRLRAESKAKSILGVKKVVNSINVEKTK